ncbi:hypothetical protein FKM82_023526 [Ascaphus truei]
MRAFSALTAASLRLYSALARAASAAARALVAFVLALDALDCADLADLDECLDVLERCDAVSSKRSFLLLSASVIVVRTRLCRARSMLLCKSLSCRLSLVLALVR